MPAAAPTAPLPRRHAALDGLRALALLPVVVVNFSGYATLPWDGPLAAPRPDEGLAAWGTTVLVLALLQGKGILLLMLLFGYGLALGGAARRRLGRLLGVGLLHGLLVYCGDIVSQYALAGLWLRRRLGQRLGRLWRLARRALVLGVVWMLVQALVAWAWPVPAAPDERPLAAWTGVGDWWSANATSFVWWLLSAVLGLGPWLVGMVAAGLVAGRLGGLHRARWRPRWQRLARWAGPVLALNLAYSAALAEQLVGRADPLAALGHTALGAAAVLTWVPWLLLRRRWPAWLAGAGRQTLSLYLACSLVSVLAWCAWAAGWTPGVVEAVLASLVLWAVLVAWGARATARGQRLPAEALMAWRSRPAAAGGAGAA